MAASSSSPVAVIGGSHLKNSVAASRKFSHQFFHLKTLAFPIRENHVKLHRRLAVQAQYSNSTRGGGGGGAGEFVAGFLIGGAVFGTLAYVFASQIRRLLLNEDDYEFWKAKGLTYYDEGLERTRQTPNAKVSQLNSAIDNVSTLLRGRKDEAQEPIEADQEVEAIN